MSDACQDNGPNVVIDLYQCSGRIYIYIYIYMYMYTNIMSSAPVDCIIRLADSHVQEIVLRIACSAVLAMLSVHACFLPLTPIRKDACVHSPCFFGRHDEGCCFEGHSMSLLSLLCAFSSPFGGKIQTLHTSEKDIIPTLHASLHCEHGRTVVTAVNGLPRVVIMNVAVWKGAPCP